MKVSRVRSVLYAIARILGDLTAVRKGKARRRVLRRVIGKQVGKRMGRWSG